MDTAPGIPLASATSGVPSSPAEGESSSSAVTWNSPPGFLSPWPRARPLESLRLGCWSQGSVPDVLMNSWSCLVKWGDREVQEKFLFFLLKILPFLFMGESIYTHTQHHAALNSQGNFSHRWDLRMFTVWPGFCSSASGTNPLSPHSGLFSFFFSCSCWHGLPHSWR